MNELTEIKQRLGSLKVCQNGFIKVGDVKEVIAFIEGLMYEKEKTNDR